MNKILCAVIKHNQTNNFSLNFDKNNHSHNMRSKSKLKQMQYEIIIEGNVNPIRNELQLAELWSNSHSYQNVLIPLPSERGL